VNNCEYRQSFVDVDRINFVGLSISPTQREAEETRQTQNSSDVHSVQVQVQAARSDRMSKRCHSQSKRVIRNNNTEAC